MAKDKFIIEPHFRLHEWVAEEKGYFKDEGLDYEFRETRAVERRRVAAAWRQGRRDADVRAGPQVRHLLRLPLDGERRRHQGPRQALRRCLSGLACGIFVPPDSKVKTPEDLAGVPISVGYQSGSHYATIQALEQFMPQDKINLSFKDGMLFGRMEKLLDGEVPACTLFSGPYYFAEQLGFRKVIDSTFMMATMITGDPDLEDVQKFFRALQAGAARHRPAAGALHAALQEGVPQALPRHDGHAPLGPGRAHRVRAVLPRDLRGLARLDRRARHLRRQRSRRKATTTRWCGCDVIAHPCPALQPADGAGPACRSLPPRAARCSRSSVA